MNEFECRDAAASVERGPLESLIVPTGQFPADYPHVDVHTGTHRLCNQALSVRLCMSTALTSFISAPARAASLCIASPRQTAGALTVAALACASTASMTVQPKGCTTAARCACS